jgi:hypothetical protein
MWCNIYRETVLAQLIDKRHPHCFPCAQEFICGKALHFIPFPSMTHGLDEYTITLFYALFRKVEVKADA